MSLCPATGSCTRFSRLGKRPRWQHISQRGLSRMVRMLNEEDPVRATIPPGSTAGRTAARTALTGADLHRPVPRRPAPEVLAAALALIAAPPAGLPAARSKSADHL